MPKVSAKKKCCKDRPRCKACPVVLMRLSKMGYAEQLTTGKKATYAVEKKVPKKAVLVARQR
ncbi:hypothetical protein LL946_15395 [Knoellia locipacati]|uniref:hypothetical protein n=1 Tax=Knoellia locipacati TaxID=882824 RepID=UPI003850725E